MIAQQHQNEGKFQGHKRGKQGHQSRLGMVHRKMNYEGTSTHLRYAYEPPISQVDCRIQPVREESFAKW
jgi:hypothetical protein